MWLRIVSYFLEGQGYQVQSAESGKEALNTLKQFKPDLILSDVRMPDMNGFELLANFRKLPATSSTPVVFFSAIDDFDARKTAKELGAKDYIVKPFDEQEVSNVLAKFFPK